MAFQVEFKKAGRSFEWNETFENLLGFAEGKGIEIENVCRVGVCGTCKTRIFSGEVAMDTEEGLSTEDKANNLFLPCVAIPLSNLVIEA